MGGRPPLPMEVKRRRGRTSSTDSGGRPLPLSGEVVSLRPSDGVPDFPDGLLLPGQSMWERVWTAGAVWIALATDSAAVERVCRLTDDLALARDMYRMTHDAEDGRLVVAMSKELGGALSVLGFDPTSRSRLGVAEVRAVSALEGIIKRNQGA